MSLVKLILLCTIPIVFCQELWNHVGEESMRRKRNTEDDRISELNSKDKMKLHVHLLPKPKDKLSAPHRVPQKIIIRPNNIRHSENFKTVSKPKNNLIHNVVPANHFIQIPNNNNKIATTSANKKEIVVLQNDTSPALVGPGDSQTTDLPITPINKSEYTLGSSNAPQENEQSTTTSVENKDFTNLESNILKKLPHLIESILSAKIRNDSEPNSKTQPLTKTSAEVMDSLHKSNAIEVPKKETTNNIIKEEYIEKTKPVNNTKPISKEAKLDYKAITRIGEQSTKDVKINTVTDTADTNLLTPCNKILKNNQDKNMKSILFQPIVNDEIRSGQTSSEIERIAPGFIENEKKDEVTLTQQNYSDVREANSDVLNDFGTGNKPMYENQNCETPGGAAYYPHYSYSYNSMYTQPNNKYSYQYKLNNDGNSFKIWEETSRNGLDVEGVNKFWNSWSNTAVIIKGPMKPLGIQITPYQQIPYSNYYYDYVKPMLSSYPRYVYPNFSNGIVSYSYQ